MVLPLKIILTVNNLIPLENNYIEMVENTNDAQSLDLSQLNEMFVTDLEVVRALTDPTKMKIMEAVGPKPQTVKQIAAALKMVPNNLYYHINQLENFNLIKVVSTRVVSGIIEKQYISAARTYTFSRTLISEANPNQDEVNEVMYNRILSLVELTSSEAKESLRAGLFGPGIISSMTNVKHRLTQAQVSLIADKFQELINSPEFEELKSGGDDTARDYRVTFSIFPLVENGTNQEPE